MRRPLGSGDPQIGVPVPEQCPECARFLSGDFVAALSAASAPCPKCDVTLTVEMFAVAPDAGTGETPPPPMGADADPEASVRPPDQAAVRPPDLPADDVGPGPGGGGDPLAGWDTDPEVVDLARWRREHRGLDPQAVAMLAVVAVGAGAGVGAAASRDRSPSRGAVLGGLAGVLAALVVGQVRRR
jgi:hypothetical protein